MRKKYIDKVVSIVNSAIEEVSITSLMLDDDLQPLGMDSITFIRIIVSLEDEFDIEFPDDFLLVEKMSTLNKIISSIELLLNDLDSQSVE